MSERAPWTRWIITKAAVKRLAVLAVLLAACLVWVRVSMLAMPGDSFEGSPPPLGPDEIELRDELRAAVSRLAGEIGPRNVYYLERLRAAEALLAAELEGMGYTVERQPIAVEEALFYNLAVELRGARRPGEVVVVGAHYDTCGDSPGADDNASGVAATLALERRFRDARPARSLRWPLGRPLGDERRARPWESAQAA